MVASDVHDVFVDGISNAGGVGIDVAAGCRGLVLRRCWVNGSDGVTMTDIARAAPACGCTRMTC